MMNAWRKFCRGETLTQTGCLGDPGHPGFKPRNATMSLLENSHCHPER